MNAGLRAPMALDHMAAGEWIVKSRREARAAADFDGLRADRPGGGAAAAIAEHDWRHARRWRRHRMTIEQQRAAEAVDQQGELRLDRLVVRPVGLTQALVELLAADRPPPQIAMLLSARGDDPEPAARPCAHAAAAGAVHHRGIDLVLGTVAIHRRAGAARDHRSATALERSPHEPIDQRVLERRQRG